MRQWNLAVVLHAANPRMPERVKDHRPVPLASTVDETNTRTTAPRISAATAGGGTGTVEGQGRGNPFARFVAFCTGSTLVTRPASAGLSLLVQLGLRPDAVVVYRVVASPPREDRDLELGAWLIALIGGLSGEIGIEGGGDSASPAGVPILLRYAPILPRLQWHLQPPCCGRHDPMTNPRRLMPGPPPKPASQRRRRTRRQPWSSSQPPESTALTCPSSSVTSARRRNAGWETVWSSPTDPAKRRVTLLSCQAQGFSATAPCTRRGA